MGDLQKVVKELRKGRHNIEREVKKGIKKIRPDVKQFLKDNSREIAKAVWDLMKDVSAGGNGFEEFCKKLEEKIDEFFE